MQTVRYPPAGKHAGILCLDPALASEYIDQGANFVGVGADTLILATGLKHLAQSCKGGEAAAPEPPQAGY